MAQFLDVRGLFSKVLSRMKSQDQTDYISAMCDDVMIYILSRLPVETVLSCKLVCRRWYSVIASQHFVAAHLKRCRMVSTAVLLDAPGFHSVRPPMIFIDSVEKTGKFARVGVSQFDQERMLYFCGSCNGLLLLRYIASREFMLFNPVTREVITLTVPREDVCGFFFDESDREYKLVQCSQVDTEGVHYYTVYGLRTKEQKQLGTSTFAPWYKRVEFVNLPKAICWMVVPLDDIGIDGEPKYNFNCSCCIMLFELDTQTISVIPHPESVCMCRFSSVCKVKLLEMEGCLVCAIPGREVIEIWVLEDLLNRSWVKRFVVNLEGDLAYSLYIEMLNISDGELLLKVSQHLSWYNLQRKTLRTIRIKRDLSDMLSVNVSAISFVKSFVSPRDLLG